MPWERKTGSSNGMRTSLTPGGARRGYPARMKTPKTIALALLALGACKAAPADASTEGLAAVPEGLPEVRYYMIADT